MQKKNNQCKSNLITTPPKNSPVQVEQIVIYDNQEVTKELTGSTLSPEMRELFNNTDPETKKTILELIANDAAAIVKIKKAYAKSIFIVPIIGQVFTFGLGISGIVASLLLARSGFSSEAIATIILSFSPIILSALKSLKR